MSVITAHTTTLSTSHRRRWIALALLALADFMVILDATVVNVALPSIGRGLDLNKGSLSWVINGYLLTFGGLLLLGGRLADLLGRRRIFLVGLGVFTAASLAGGFAQNEAWLVAARAIQGAGAGLLAPAALSLVTVTFADGPERHRALGIWGAVAGSGAAAGVLLGGVLTDALNWRWVLFINVPVGISVSLLAPLFVDESRVTVGRKGFDLGGAATITAALGTLVYGLIGTTSHGWGSGRTITLLAAAVALFALFVVIERRERNPLVPFTIFRIGTVAGANAAALLIGGALTATFFFLSLYMQQVLHYSPLTAGIAQLPLAVAIILAAGAASPLVTRFGPRRLIAVGLLLYAAALLWLTRAPVDGHFLGDLLGPSLILCVGLGIAFVPLTVAAVTGVDQQQAGLTSGLVNTTQQIGGALGLAIAATIANTHTNHLLARHAHNGFAHALTSGFHYGFITAAALAAIGAVAAATLIKPRNKELESVLEPAA